MSAAKHTIIAPYREDLVVAVECIFTWYWVADLCTREGIAFVLGHAESLTGLNSPLRSISPGIYSFGGRDVL